MTNILIKRIVKRYFTVIFFLEFICFFLGGFFKRKAILIGIPDYTNIGDTAIAEASELWIKKNFPDYSYLGLQERYYLRIRKILPFFSKKNDRLFLQGGGNMGDRYPGLEGIRREIVTKYPDNKVVFMPVTIYFSDTVNGQKELMLSKRAYNAHTCLSILTRDEASADFAKKHFNKTQVINVPDIVCSKLETGFVPSRLKRNHKILICKRNDVENNSSFEELIRVAGLQPSDYIYQDTELWNSKNKIIYKTRFANYNEQLADLYQILNVFSESSLVVTDRYHGLIFSYITSTPCVVIDNSDHKIREGVKWFSDCNYVFYAGSDLQLVSEMIEKAKEIEHCSTSQSIKQRFVELKNLLIEQDEKS